MRIVQVANFVSPTSGGIKTALGRLRAGYAAAGHETALVIPGATTSAGRDASGSVVVQVRAPQVPGMGGYRMITDLRAVRRALDDLAPDRLEVHDRLTLRSLGRQASACGVPATVVVHERLDRLAGMYLPWVLRPGAVARRDNVALASSFSTVVCPSRWAAQEFAAVENVEVVGWGVELDRFHPDRRRDAVRHRLLRGAEVLVAMVCRLSPEKRAQRAIDAIGVLRRRGVAVRMVVAGTGRSERELRRRAAGLPVTFLGHVADRAAVADLLAAADVAICPGPLETFGLAALESLASGTPVVSARSGAVPELLAGPHGHPAHSHGPSMATAVQVLLEAGRDARQAARTEAERHPWHAAVDRMLQLHGAASLPAV